MRFTRRAVIFRLTVRLIAVLLAARGISSAAEITSAQALRQLLESRMGVPDGP